MATVPKAAKVPKTAMSNPVKIYASPVALAAATSYRAVNKLIDQATLEAANQRSILWEDIKKDFLQSFGEHQVFGNYQIQLSDDEIVEVPLQVGPEALTMAETSALSKLPIPILEGLFDTVPKMSYSLDTDQLQQTLAMMDPADFAKLVSVSSKGASIMFECPVTSLTLGVSNSPRTQFVARLKKVLTDEAHTQEDEALLADWFKDRIRGQVKTGNRAKEES